MVLEEGPQQESGPSRRWQLLVVSARTGDALETLTASLARHLRDEPDLPLADVAFTLRVGRRRLAHRRVAVCRDRNDALAALEKRQVRRLLTFAADERQRHPVFLFPGLGEQYVGMAAGLYRDEPAFRDTVDRCCALLEGELKVDLRRVMFGDGEGTAEGERDGADAAATPDLRRMLGRGDAGADEDDEAARRLSRTELSQPAVFVVEYALARLLADWGVRPQGMIGYSLGEYVAACLAGVMSLEDALRLVARRAACIAELPPGAMLAVPLPEAEAEERLAALAADGENGAGGDGGPAPVVAAVNGPSLCVVSGSVEAVDELQRRWEDEGLACRRLATTHAFHSPMMEAAAPRLRELLSRVRLQPPAVPYVSNVTGTWIEPGEATDPEYWVRHLCRPVRFAAGVETLLAEEDRVLLEVGPGQSLGSFVKQHPACAPQRAALVMATLRGGFERGEDQAVLLTALGKLWMAGVEADWPGFHGDEERRRVALPGYPFEPRRHWLLPDQPGDEFYSRYISTEVKADLEDWFYEPVWEAAEPVAPRPSDGEETRWLLVLDEHGVGERLAERLVDRGDRVAVVRPGGAFERRGEESWVVGPRRDDHDALLKDLVAGPGVPQRIVHLACVDPQEADAANGGEGDLGALAAALDRGFYSLIYLAQAIGERLITDPIDLTVVTSGLRQVAADDPLAPLKAPVLGPTKVIPQELANLSCRSVDVRLGGDGAAAEALTDHLFAEVTSQAPEEVVALRGGERLVRTFERRPLDAEPADGGRLRRGGVYLITGGLGGLGLGLAEHLHTSVGARLGLLSRSPLPPRDEWDGILAESPDAERGVAYRVRKVRQLEEAGAEVLTVAADVTDAEAMAAAVGEVRQRFGGIDGVVHAAGVPGQGLIQLKTPEVAQRVLGPKVHGTLILESLLADDDLDFLLLFSSMSSITGGGPGQSDYCAANAFLDVFGRQRHGRHGVTQAVDWGEWQWDAWDEGLEGFHDEVQQYFRENRRKFGIELDEGMEAMRRILASGKPQVVVATQDFNDMVAGSSEFSAANILGEVEKNRESLPAHPRPVLGVEFVAPRNELERQVAGIWQSILGVDPIGVHDDFFELGGSSLIGIQVVSRMRQELQVEMPLRTLFDVPTVGEQAEMVETLRWAAEAEAPVDGEAAQAGDLVEGEL
jgi:acyl transferase domain-containing protein/acyl carrier protein